VRNQRLNSLSTTQNSLYSLENAFNIEELQAWQQRWQRLVPGTQNSVEYVCELKIDGSALALTYGVLVRGATRGDGITGEILLKMCEQSAQFPAIEFRKTSLIEVRGRRFTVAGVSTNQSGAGDR